MLSSLRRRITLLGVIETCGLIITYIGLFTSDVVQRTTSFSASLIYASGAVVAVCGLLWLGVEIRVRYVRQDRAYVPRALLGLMVLGLAAANLIGHRIVLEATFYAGFTLVIYLLWAMDDRARRRQLFAPEATNV